MGFVVTRTTLLATEVNFRELIQKEKWRDKKKPPSAPIRSCFLLNEVNCIPLPFAIVSKIIEEIVSRYVAIIREGTSSQNLMKIEAKEIATIPTDRQVNILTKRCLSSHFYMRSSFHGNHGEQDRKSPNILFGPQHLSSKPVPEKYRKFRFHDKKDGNEQEAKIGQKSKILDAHRDTLH